MIGLGIVTNSIYNWIITVNGGIPSYGIWDDDITSDEMDHSRKFPALSLAPVRWQWCRFFLFNPTWDDDSSSACFFLSFPTLVLKKRPLEPTRLGCETLSSWVKHLVLQRVASSWHMANWLVVTGTWLDYDFPKTVGNGMSSSQLMNSPTIISQRGRYPLVN